MIKADVKQHTAHADLKRDEPQKTESSEVCVECGRSVAMGSGNFVNRVPVLDDLETKKQNGYAFPHGDWMCPDCDACETFNCEDCTEKVKG